MAAGRVCHFKLVLLGDTAVGKSCLVVRFVRDEFFEYQEPTIGAAFLTQTVQLDDATVKFEIWDTAGQERYRSLAPMYYRGAAAAIVVYDVTNKDSFNGAKSWVKELQRRGDPNVIIALAGNKADLEHRRDVKAEEARYVNCQPSVRFPCSIAFSGSIRQLLQLWLFSVDSIFPFLSVCVLWLALVFDLLCVNCNESGWISVVSNAPRRQRDNRCAFLCLTLPPSRVHAIACNVRKGLLPRSPLLDPSLSCLPRILW
ncbi:unnamed protein product [Phaeothamnion confervicola]